MKQMTITEWRTEAARRFGFDEMAWAFRCPSCGHIATIQDWKDAGAPSSAAPFSCVGRWLGSKKEIGQKPGPCNYAGGGLFRLNPVRVVFQDGTTVDVFDFAEGQQ